LKKRKSSNNSRPEGFELPGAFGTAGDRITLLYRTNNKMSTPVIPVSQPAHVANTEPVVLVPPLDQTSGSAPFLTSIVGDKYVYNKRNLALVN
jgi:hypothetical protein